ncbi:uncharacterized protein VTP21DRAFT_8947 [Calcarisporiella thermophila]|uniref:uncharacterized protein n=1 Tax=Calcarisporiella thermophila TaxID=911321 RepID=UPI0037428B2F
MIMKPISNKIRARILQLSQEDYSHRQIDTLLGNYHITVTNYVKTQDVHDKKPAKMRPGRPTILTEGNECKIDSLVSSRRCSKLLRPKITLESSVRPEFTRYIKAHISEI